MSSKKTNTKKIAKSGIKVEPRKEISAKEREKQYEIEEGYKLLEIERDLLRNIDKFPESEQMKLINALRHSIDKKLDEFERKIQTQMTPEEKKEKYRHLFDENGYGDISITSGISYIEEEQVEESNIKEVWIDDVDWKNVIGTIQHYEYDEIPQVLERIPVFDFFGKSKWEKRKQLKEWIKDKLLYIEDFREGIFPDERDRVLRERLRTVEDDINAYKKVGYADEVKDEEEKVIALRKKYNIWR